MSALNATSTSHLSATERLTAALVAAFIGMALVYTAGFANASTLHNAAHDWRHAHNFPCH